MDKPIFMYTVPVSKTLHALFESKCFRDAFFANDHVCEPGVWKNVCCGSLYRLGELRGTVVIIQLYYDGVNLVDGLKQSANIM